ncbi:MAG TPA: DUF11 domain-containing protein, partial [Thermoanaerobaculia bacterium]
GGPDLNPSDNVASVITPLAAGTGPDLALAKTGPSSAAPGGTIAYSLVVSNEGNQGASGVVLTEVVPGHTTFNAGASDAGWTCSDGAGAGTSCAFGFGGLAAGASTTVVFAVEVVDPVPAGVTAVANTATVAEDGSGGGEQDPTDNSDSTITPLTAGTGPDLAISKTGPRVAAPGDTLAYTLVITNEGNQGASGVVLTEVVPDHTTFNAGVSEAGWSCPDGAAAGTSCTFPVGSVGAGASATILFAVDVLDPLPAGVTAIANSASVAEDGSGGGEQDPSDDDTSLDIPLTPATGPDMAISKSGPSSAAPGDTLLFSLVVTNEGNQNRRAIVAASFAHLSAGPKIAESAGPPVFGGPGYPRRLEMKARASCLVIALLILTAAPWVGASPGAAEPSTPPDQAQQPVEPDATLADLTDEEIGLSDLETELLLSEDDPPRSLDRAADDRLTASAVFVGCGFPPPPPPPSVICPACECNRCWRNGQLAKCIQF